MGFPQALFQLTPMPDTIPEVVGVLAAIPITKQDNLALRIRNGVPGQTVILSAKVLSPDGTLEFLSATFTPTTDRLVSLHTMALVAGWLISVHVHVTATTLRGQTYISLGLQTGTLFDYTAHSATLISAYATTELPLGFPPGLIESPRSGRGRIIRINGTNPGAGANFSQTVSTGSVWKIHTVKFRMDTDANVANRTPGIEVNISATSTIFLMSEFQQTASQIGHYTFYPGAVQSSITAASGQIFRSIPMPLLELEEGDGILGFVQNRQAGDTQTEIVFYIEEFLED